MKLNKILPITAIAGTAAIVAPMITSCSCARSVKTVWEKKEATQQYEGYTQKCVDSENQIKYGEIAEKYFNFQNVRQSINDDLIRSTLKYSVTTDTGTFIVETSKFDRDSLRLTSKIQFNGESQAGAKINFLLNFDNVPMEFTFVPSGIVYLNPLGVLSSQSSQAIWGLPNWEITCTNGEGLNMKFSPNSTSQEIAIFYDDDYTYILMTELSYFDGIQIK